MALLCVWQAWGAGHKFWAVHLWRFPGANRVGRPGGVALACCAARVAGVMLIITCSVIIVWPDVTWLRGPLAETSLPGSLRRIFNGLSMAACV